MVAVSSKPTYTPFLVYAAAFTAFIAMYLPQPVLPQIAEEFGVSASGAGLLISGLVLSIAFMSVVVAPLADRVGRKPVLVGCSLLLALPSLACALAPSYGVLLLMRFAQGALVPGILAISVVYLAEEFSAEHSPVLIGGYVSSTVLGGMTSRLLSGAVSEVLDWRWAFGLSSLLSLCVGLILLVLLPASSQFRAEGRLSGAYRGMVSHLRDRRLVGGYLVGFLLFFAFLGVFTYLPFYLAAPPYGFSPLYIGLVYIVYGAGVFSSPLGGRLARRLPFWQVLGLGFALTLGGNLLTLVPNTTVLVTALVLLCLGNFIVQGAATAFIPRTAEHNRAGANALYLLFYYIGGSLGGYLPGLLWPTLGWEGVLLLTVGSLALGTLVAVTLCRT